jgi:membrane-bound lytic murein transglycosylase B
LASARKNETVIRLISPAPPDKKVWRSWQTYRSRFVEPKRIAWGIEFYKQHQDTLQLAHQRFKVPASTIVAIIGVETLYGRNMGNFRIADALTTLALHYPETNNQAEAGAIGLPQFMPGIIMRYAIDGDNNGQVDLSNNPTDAILSVANFLVKHGWQPDLPVFVPVVLPENPAALVNGGLTPTLEWPALKDMGARFAHEASNQKWTSFPLGVIDLVEEAQGTSQYLTATPHFFALTHYNRSYFYATSVAGLADAIDISLRNPKQPAKR